MIDRMIHWPLRAREREYDAVLGALTGPPGAAIVTGPAGCGRTHLLRQIADDLGARGHSVARVFGSQAAASIPFAPFAAYLPAGGDADPTRLLLLLAERLTRPVGGRPPVVVVDDVHLLDEGSAALVHHLAAADGPWLLGSARSDTVVAATVNRLWRDRHARRVPVEPFTAEQLATVLGAALGAPVDAYTVSRLHRLTGGSALLCRELVEAGLASGQLDERAGVWQWTGAWRATASIAEIFSERLAGCTAEERDVLAMIALGEPLGFDVLARATRLEIVEALADRGHLVTPPGSRLVTLSTPLYAEVLRTTTSAATMRRVSRQLAECLDADGDPLLRVKLLDDAGDRPADADLLAAAVAALERGRWDDAEDLARRAAPDPERSRVLARVLTRKGRHEDAAAELLTPTGTPDEVDVAAVVATYCRGMRSDLALSYLDGLPAQPSLAVHRAYALSSAARYEEAIGVCADDPLLRTVQPHQMWAVHMLAAANYQTGRLDTAYALLAQHDTDEVTTEARVAMRFGRCGTLAAMGRLDEADEVAADLLALGSEVLRPDMMCIATSTRAALAAERGRWEAAAEGQRTAIAVGRLHAPGTSLHGMLCRLALAEAAAGRTSAAFNALAEAEAYRSERPAYWVLVDEEERSHGFVLACAGQTTEAVARLGTLAERTIEQGAYQLAVEVALLVARIGQPTRAARWLDRVPIRHAYTGVHADFARTLAAPEPDAFRALADAYADRGAYGLAAEAADHAARGFARAGRNRAATAAAVWRTRVQDEHEVTQLPWWPSAIRVELTAREREIAALAAAGLSNQEISDRLTVSARTVENHLYRVYAKLGVRGRAELAEALGATPSRRPVRP